MTRTPYILTASRVARRWHLPIDEARLIVQAELRRLPRRQMAWIATIQLGGMVLAFLVPPLLASLLSEGLRLTLQLVGIFMYVSHWALTYLAARPAIMARADTARSVDSGGQKTRQLAAAMDACVHGAGPG